MNDFLKSVLPKALPDDFSTSNWKNRRQVIFGALIVCAFCIISITLIVVAAMGVTAWKGASPSYDTNLLRLAETILWAVVALAGSVIGSYVFGANFDTKDYRKNAVEMQVRGVSTTVESKVTTAAAPAIPVTPPDAGDQPNDTNTIITVDPGTTTTVQTTKTEGPAG